MERTAKTMGYLYSGLGYEYYTASLLWGMGFEAYKMEADFGFDIMAYNQKNRSFENDSESKPYLFQVKMRREYKTIEVDSGGGIRRISEQKFTFGKEDFERLRKEKNSYMVCYFVEATDKIERIIGSFWLNNYQIKWLHQIENEWKCFEEHNDKVTIKAKLESKASSKKEVLMRCGDIYQKIESLKDKLAMSDIKKLDIILENQKRLNSWIERSTLINENTNTNIYLGGITAKGNETYRILNSEQVKFLEFVNENENPPIRVYI
ncbi:MAG: hypothetical protein ACRC30_01330 [Clostridium sp.]